MFRLSPHSASFNIFANCFLLRDCRDVFYCLHNTGSVILVLCLLYYRLAMDQRVTKFTTQALCWSPRATWIRCSRTMIAKSKKLLDVHALTRLRSERLRLKGTEYQTIHCLFLVDEPVLVDTKSSKSIIRKISLREKFGWVIFPCEIELVIGWGFLIFHLYS